MNLALVLGGVLAASAVLLAAWPFLREPRQDEGLHGLDPATRRRVALAEERDRALSALKELEFDHRTGKVTDEDYRLLLGPLRRQAAEALRAVESAAPADAASEPVAEKTGKVSPTTRTFVGREGRPTA